MRYLPISPPRVFSAGRPEREVILAHQADIELEPDELVTFVTDEGAAYDVTRKQWGFYMTPSLNRRLPENGLRPLIAANPEGDLYLVLIAAGHEGDFDQYAIQQDMQPVLWLDQGLSASESEMP